MIKRLVSVAFLTGLGQLTTLFSLKYIATAIDSSTIALIGEIDALTLLVVSIIAFGLQLSAARHMAIAENWRQELAETQSARLMLALFLTLLGITGVIYTQNYLFMLAPVISLNADYALYGRGKPTQAALISWIRVSIPALTLILASLFFKEHIAILFAASLLFTYWVAGVLVSFALKAPYWVVPRWKNLKKYTDNFTLGIANFAAFFIGIGIITIMAYVYTSPTIAVVYIALKLYMIFKGVKRVIIHSFFKELQEKTMPLKVDALAMIAGLVFLGTLIFFPTVIISLLFDEAYTTYTCTFVILGIAGLISSFTTSSGMSLLLKEKDKPYSLNLIIASGVSIISGLLLWYFMGSKPYLIAIAVLLGEITTSLLNATALKEPGFWKTRIKVISIPVLLLGVFWGCKQVWGENLLSFLGALLVYGLLNMAYFIKRVK